MSDGQLADEVAAAAGERLARAQAERQRRAAAPDPGAVGPRPDRHALWNGRVVRVVGLDAGTATVYDPSTQNRRDVPAGELSTSGASKADPAVVALGEVQRDIARLRFDDVLTGDPVSDDRFGAYLSADRATLAVHNVPDTVSTLDTAIDSLTGAVADGGFDQLQTARLRGELRSIQSLRDQIATLAGPGHGPGAPVHWQQALRGAARAGLAEPTASAPPTDPAPQPGAQLVNADEFADLSRGELNELNLQHWQRVMGLHRQGRGDGDAEYDAAKAELERTAAVFGRRQNPPLTGDLALDLANRVLARAYRRPDFRGVFEPDDASGVLRALRAAIDPRTEHQLLGVVEVAEGLLGNSAQRADRYDRTAADAVSRLDSERVRAAAGGYAALAEALDLLGVGGTQSGHTFTRAAGQVGRSRGNPISQNLRDYAAALHRAADDADRGDRARPAAAPQPEALDQGADPDAPTADTATVDDRQFGPAEWVNEYGITAGDYPTLTADQLCVGDQAKFAHGDVGTITAIEPNSSNMLRLTYEGINQSTSRTKRRTARLPILNARGHGPRTLDEPLREAEAREGDARERAAARQDTVDGIAVDPGRQRQIIRALEDYAARYGVPDAPGGGGPANAARYVIEGHVRDASAAEWDWAYDYLRAHPQLLHGPVKTDAEIAAARQRDRGQAQQLSGQARQAFDAGDRARALELIDQAAELDPGDASRWEQIRTLIRGAENTPAGAVLADRLLQAPSAAAQRAEVQQLSTEDLQALSAELEHRGSTSNLRRIVSDTIAERTGDRDPAEATAANEHDRMQQLRDDLSTSPTVDESVAQAPAASTPRGMRSIEAIDHDLADVTRQLEQVEQQVREAEERARTASPGHETELRAAVTSGRLARSELVDRRQRLAYERRLAEFDLGPTSDARSGAAHGPARLDPAAAIDQPVAEDAASRADSPAARPGPEDERGTSHEVEAVVAAAAPRFRPSGQEDLAPSGAVARVRANLAALRTLRTIQREERPAAAVEQAVLARWSGWGAVPEVFDTGRDDFAWAREQLNDLLNEDEWAAASRNTLNAHYTDLGLVGPIWSALGELGFTEGRVLEPGCGSGNFVGTAPPGADMVGVEVDPITAQIAAALYPDAQILAESFAVTRAPEGSFDLVVGNVPFAKATLNDRQLVVQGTYSVPAVCPDRAATKACQSRAASRDQRAAVTW